MPQIWILKRRGLYPMKCIIETEKCISFWLVLITVEGYIIYILGTFLLQCRIGQKCKILLWWIMFNMWPIDSFKIIISSINLKMHALNYMYWYVIDKNLNQQRVPFDWHWCQSSSFTRFAPTRIFRHIVIC